MKAALVTLKTSETFTQTFGCCRKPANGKDPCGVCNSGMVQQLQFRISEIQMINPQDLTPEDLASTPPKLAVGLQQSSAGHNHRSWRDTLKLRLYLKYRPCLFIVLI